MVTVLLRVAVRAVGASLWLHLRKQPADDKSGRAARNRILAGVGCHGRNYGSRRPQTELIVFMLLGDLTVSRRRRTLYVRSGGSFVGSNNKEETRPGRYGNLTYGGCRR